MPDHVNQDDSEKPAKVWQVSALAVQLDDLNVNLSEVKQLIKDQSQTYPTKTELALELEKRDNKIKSLEKTLANFTKFVWVLASAIVPIVALTIWQLIINTGKGNAS